MATELKALRPILQADLKTLTTNVFYEQTKGAPTFPYVVFTINSFGYNEVMNVAELEVDVYDNKDDTTALETLAENIWKKYDHMYYLNENVCFNAYQNIRNSVNLGDGVHLRRLQFELRIC